MKATIEFHNDKGELIHKARIYDMNGMSTFGLVYPHLTVDNRILLGFTVTVKSRRIREPAPEPERCECCGQIITEEPK